MRSSRVSIRHLLRIIPWHVYMGLSHIRSELLIGLISRPPFSFLNFGWEVWWKKLGHLSFPHQNLYFSIFTNQLDLGDLSDFNVRDLLIFIFRQFILVELLSYVVMKSSGDEMHSYCFICGTDQCGNHLIGVREICWSASRFHGGAPG